MARAPTARSPAPPAGFRVLRSVPLGRHPLLAVFPGLDRLATARRQEPNGALRQRLLEETCVEIVAEDLWMYVAPRSRPKTAPRRWAPRLSETDCVVIGESHLRESPAIVLFLDIFHELCHLQQRRDGLELFDRPESYVRRPTEIEAYRFVVEEGRRLGLSNDVLRDYLKVEWVSDEEHLDLLITLGVPAHD